MKNKMYRFISAVVAVIFVFNSTINSFNKSDIDSLDIDNLDIDFSFVLNTFKSKAEDIVYSYNAENLPDGVYDSANNKYIFSSTTAAKFSHIDPSVYQNATIEITMSGADIDLTSLKNEDLKFIGLGSENCPFNGTIVYTSGSEAYSLILDVPFFNAVTDTAKIDFINLTGSDSGRALFAEKVVHNSDENNLNTNIKCYGTFAGLINTIGENSKISLSVEPGSVSISGSGNLGIFCNTMASGSDLTISDTSNLNFTVATSNGHAGSAVGKMMQNTTLSFINDYNYSGSISTSGAGNCAGGIVGYSDGGKIVVADTKVAKINSTLYASGGCVGGIAGTYINSGTDTLDLSKFLLNNTFKNSVYAGGLFGRLEQTGENSSFTINGGNKVISSTDSTNQNVGGLIGGYQSGNLKNTLSIGNNTESQCGEAKTVLGGIIGVSEDCSYIKINNIKVAFGTGAETIGGVIGTSEFGSMIDVKDFTSLSSFFALKKCGGIAGSMAGGVIRLSGVTDFSNISFTINDDNKDVLIGQILEGNYGAVVYAEDGWTLKRGESAKVSDIGSYGAVIRSTNDISGLFTFDEAAHTVTVAGFNKDSISSAQDFAAMAVSMQSVNSKGALILTNTITPSDNITLASGVSINLRGTGITGILRDDGTQTYTGTFNGNNSTIVLGIGELYGNRGNTSASGNGSGQIYKHSYIGLFGKIDGATISNITLAGIENYGIRKNIQYAGGLTAYASGTCNFENVTSAISINATADVETGYKNYTGGFIGYSEGNVNLSFNNCKWSSAITDSIKYSDKYAHSIGGYVGFIDKGASSVNINSCSIEQAGIIEKIAKQNCVAGGLIGSINFDYANDCDGVSSLTIDGLVIKEEDLTTKSTSTSGGLLGYLWNNVNVQMKNISISDATLNTQSTNFGGLVYAGSGYWQIIEQGIKFISSNKFTGKTDSSTPSGLIVCHADDYVSTILDRKYPNLCNNYLYLSIDKDSYKINTDSVTLSGVSGNFDEIAGITINSADSRRNGVVSINTSDGKVDVSGCNTYTKQLSQDFKNNKTRYYYNLDIIRNNSIDLSNGINNADELMCWSLYNYAGDNINSLFSSGSTSNIIEGNIDLSGYSYYPIDFSSDLKINNATITFDNKTIEDAEKTNKPTTDSEGQHYMMQFGLIRNYTATQGKASEISMYKTTWRGTIGAVSGSYSGALICGDTKGVLYNKNIYLASVKTSEYNNNQINILFDGIVINEKDGRKDSALFINNMSDKIRLSFDGVKTNYQDSNKIAGSIIGTIGNVSDSKAPSNLSVAFKNMKIDNIFSNALFINNFAYTDETTCGGTYTFNKDDELVTYGKEISNYSENGVNVGRNARKQWHYFDEQSTPVTDGNITAAIAPTSKGSFYTDSYGRYVGNVENSNDKHELNVNQGVATMTGCGTYGDPYVITLGSQLETLSDYLNGKLGNCSGWEFDIDTDNYEGKASSKDETHIQSEQHTHIVFNGEKWENVTDQAAITEYLRNAYYLIENDITVGESGFFQGIGDSTVEPATAGSTTRSFCGVIAGKKKDDGSYPEITILRPNNAVKQYGGLIRYSNGSVVKDLNINIVDEITIDSEKLPSEMVSGTDNQSNPEREPRNQVFFGGVIGYALGGDNIIDNVSVTYNEITVTGKYDYEANVGGYVGLIGGSIKEGGGVIFRNMSGKNGFTLINNVNTTTEVLTNYNADDKTQENKILDGGNQYFYWNPYIGRVLDGFAFYDSDSGSINNTDKNYKIPTINENSKIQLSKDNNSNLYAKVKVSDAQQLWILSAIVNSGAGSMSANFTTYSYSDKSYAYYYGKVRNGNYDNIGNSSYIDAEADNDEKYWGGTGTSEDGKYSYLVKKYTDTPVIAAHLTCNACSFTIEFNNITYDMSSYANGFRGIGTSFEDNATTDVQQRCMPIYGITGNNANIILNRNLYEYSDDINVWWTQGMGK